VKKLTKPVDKLPTFILEEFINALALKTLSLKLGVSPTTIMRKVKLGDFPPPDFQFEKQTKWKVGTIADYLSCNTKVSKERRQPSNTKLWKLPKLR